MPNNQAIKYFTIPPRVRSSLRINVPIKRLVKSVDKSSTLILNEIDYVHKMYKGLLRTAVRTIKIIETLPDDILENAVKMEYRHQMLRWPFPVVCWLHVWVAQRKYFV